MIVESWDFEWLLVGNALRLFLIKIDWWYNRARFARSSVILSMLANARFDGKGVLCLMCRHPFRMKR